MKRRNFITTAAATVAAALLPSRAQASHELGVPAAPGDWRYDKEVIRRALHPLNFIEALNKEPDGGVVFSTYSAFNFTNVERRCSIQHHAFGIRGAYDDRKLAMQLAIGKFGIDEDLVVELNTAQADHITYGRHVHEVRVPGDTNIYWIIGTHYARSIFNLAGRNFGFVLGDIASRAVPGMREVKYHVSDPQDPLPECDYWWHISGAFAERFLHDSRLCGKLA